MATPGAAAWGPAPGWRGIHSAGSLAGAECWVVLTGSGNLWCFTNVAVGLQARGLGPSCGYKGIRSHESQQPLGFWHWLLRFLCQSPVAWVQRPPWLWSMRCRACKGARQGQGPPLRQTSCVSGDWGPLGARRGLSALERNLELELRKIAAPKNNTSPGWPPDLW